MPKVVKQASHPSSRKAGRVIDRIKPLGLEDDKLRVNVYGRSATGKTTFWATFPGPLLAIVCSGGQRPGELRSINTPEHRRKIRQVMIEQSTEVQELACYAADNRLATVVLDHASGLQDLVLKEVLGLEKIPTSLSWGMATQQQYGQVAVQVKEHLRSLLSLPCNVVVVAQEREFNNEADSDLIMPYVASALTPSITGWLNPACDFIVQTFKRQRIQIKDAKIGGKKVEITQRTKGVDYCLRVGPDSVYTTKFRIPKGCNLPDVIVDPTYDKLVELIQGK